jgi:hypothetical protein
VFPKYPVRKGANMTNLYWKTRASTAILEPKPFKSESELEVFIEQNQEILGGDIFIIYHQIRTGSKQGIADMVAVDQDSRICIIEIKNVEADESILPQALQYAIWAESNPDSLRAIWLEAKSKPESIEIDWAKISLRVILVAPSFKSTVPSMASKIGYKIDLMQVRRYSYEKNEFLLVDVLDTPQVNKPGPTTVFGEWSWETYKTDHGKTPSAQFRKMVNAVDTFCQKRGWDLPYNLNKYYTGFKFGNRVVFSVHWASPYTWNMKLKIPEKVAKTYKGKQWEYQRYDNNFKEALFKCRKPDDPTVGDLKDLMQKSYDNVSGRR